MKKRIACLTALTVACCLATTAMAGDYWWYPGYRHAATVEEGVLQGQAALARGIGQYNLQTSQALMNREQAASQRLQNRLNAIHTFFKARQLNREHRAAERGPLPTPEELARYNEARKPDRLIGNAYRSELGTLQWPGVFRHPEFALQRAVVDRMIASRNSNNSGLGTRDYRTIVGAVAEMRDTLRQQIHTIHPMEYVAGKKFLDSLAYEAQFAPGGSSIAVR